MFIYCKECNCIYKEYHQVADRYDTMYVEHSLGHKKLTNNEETIVNTYKRNDSDYIVQEIYVPGDFDPSEDIKCKKNNKHHITYINYEPNKHSVEDVNKLFSLFTSTILTWWNSEKHAISLKDKTIEELFEIKRLLGVTDFNK